MGWPTGNRLLDRLPPDDPARQAAGLRVVTLRRGDTTTQANVVMESVDFPLTALMSVAGTLRDGTTIEVASVGCEGFVEIDAALSSDVALRCASCQFDGTVLRWPVREFQAKLDTSPTFHKLIHRAVRERAFITEQTAMCHLRHHVVERLARWLLVARQRLGRDDLGVTHEFLATVLGSRRAGLSEAAARLQERGAIAYGRGLITIADPGKLVEASCECFADCDRALLEMFA